jgi:hypothetical protein
MLQLLKLKSTPKERITCEMHYTAKAKVKLKAYGGVDV